MGLKTCGSGGSFMVFLLGFLMSFNGIIGVFNGFLMAFFNGVFKLILATSDSFWG